MTPRELLDTVEVPGGESLRLMRRGSDFMIVLDRNELMNSRMSGSEVALADLACNRIQMRPKPRILIGGYGMGFTLRAALHNLGPTANVDVVEIVPAILAWARGPMAALTGNCLDDPRATVIVGDVATFLAQSSRRYDAILLDVDNGPDGLSQPSNEWLYRSDGLAAAKRALRPAGVLAIWSAAPDGAFVRRLKTAGFAVEEQMVRGRSNGKGPRHVIWLATPA